MNFIKYTSIFTALLLVFLVSCEKEDPALIIPEIQPTGQWRVIAYIDEAPVSAPFSVEIYGADSDKKDSVVIKESSSDFWSFQAKAAIHPMKGTFETKLSVCEISEPGIGIKISNGKVINSDSIYFEIQFEDDETPFGIAYQIKGGRVQE